jgi:hypothetical protein
MTFQMHLHRGSDYRKFHKDFVPRCCLPSDFDGDLKSSVELHEQHIREFERLRNYFVDEEKEAKLLKSVDFII